jgi:hypothetical protein
MNTKTENNIKKKGNLFLRRCCCHCPSRLFPPEQLRDRGRLLPRRRRDGVAQRGHDQRDREADAADDEGPRDDGLLCCVFGCCCGGKGRKVRVVRRFFFFFLSRGGRGRIFDDGRRALSIPLSSSPVFYLTHPTPAPLPATEHG